MKAVGATYFDWLVNLVSMIEFISIVFKMSSEKASVRNESMSNKSSLILAEECKILEIIKRNDEIFKLC